MIYLSIKNVSIMGTFFYFRSARRCAQCGHMAAFDGVFRVELSHDLRQGNVAAMPGFVSMVGHMAAFGGGFRVELSHDLSREACRSARRCAQCGHMAAYGGGLSRRGVFY